MADRSRVRTDAPEGAPVDVGTGSGARKTSRTGRWKEDRRKEAVSAVMNTRMGRRFVWELLETANIFSDPMLDTDRMTAYNLGYQAFGRTIYAWLHGSGSETLGLFRLMQDENMEEDENAGRDGSD